ncbi:MAG: aminotransferase class I/II-fold pyridoxal phosphate-dependent enzyme [Acidimicrobiales bacterium]
MNLNISYIQHCDSVFDIISKPFNVQNYPTGAEELEKLLGGDDIVVTAGSDAALKLICDVFLTPQSRVIIPVPNYAHMINFCECITPNITKINCRTAQDVSNIDLTNADMLYVSNPNMPYGYYVHNIYELATKNPKCLFVVDQAYIEYGPKIDDEPQPHNVIITRTFSKAYGIAALRIGYIKYHNKNVLLKVHNVKSVTDVAINTAIAIVKNQKHYLTQASKICDLRDQIPTHLNRFCIENAPIHTINVQYGNYFMIFCTDPTAIYTAFKQEKMLIRDKSAEILGALRISIYNENTLNTVIDLIRRINFTSIIDRCDVAFDLDNTLRPTSKWHCPADPAIASLFNRAKNSYIVSNNPCLPETIQEWLWKNKMYTNLNHIWTPAGPELLQFLEKNDLRPFVVGRPDVKDKFQTSTNFNSVMIFSHIFVSTQEIIQISKILAQNGTIIHADPAPDVSLSDCSDFDQEGDIRIPDIGRFLNLFTYKTKMIPYIKSTQANFNVDFVVGDSQEDRQYAQNVYATYIDIKYLH